MDLIPRTLTTEAEVVMTVRANTASATASSSRDGSKKMFEPMAITKSVTGGFEDVESALSFPVRFGEG